jgi:hypothetical protein
MDELTPHSRNLRRFFMAFLAGRTSQIRERQRASTHGFVIMVMEWLNSWARKFWSKFAPDDEIFADWLKAVLAGGVCDSPHPDD